MRQDLSELPDELAARRQALRLPVHVSVAAAEARTVQLFGVLLTLEHAATLCSQSNLVRAAREADQVGAFHLAARLWWAAARKSRTESQQQRLRKRARCARRRARAIEEGR